MGDERSLAYFTSLCVSQGCVWCDAFFGIFLGPFAIRGATSSQRIVEYETMLSRSRGREFGRMAAPQWRLSGTYFEACNCNVVCPCYFFGNTPFDECTVLWAWHIEDGHFGDVPLSGINVVLAGRRDRDRGWTDESSGSVLYFDTSATQAQKDALVQIFKGQVGGVPPVMARVTSRLLGVRTAEIALEFQGKRRSLKIAGIAEAEIEGIEGRGGSDVTITNIPNTLAPAPTTTIAKSKRLVYHDHGFKWEDEGRNAVYSAFAYRGPR